MAKHSTITRERYILAERDTPQHAAVSTGLEDSSEPSATESDYKSDPAAAMKNRLAAVRPTKHFHLASPAPTECTTDHEGVSDGANTSPYRGNGFLKASVKVWGTAELLEQIVSYLPPRDIVAVSGVNKIAYICINNSSLARDKLFLSPSRHKPDFWWYYDNCLSDSHPEVRVQSFETSTDAFPPGMFFESLKKRVYAVTLCPLLKLPDNKTKAIDQMRNSEMRSLIWDVVSTEQVAHLVGVPAEGSKYANMYLSDPPISHATADLTYKHTLSALRLEAKRNVNCDRGLQFGKMIGFARKLAGEVSMSDPWKDEFKRYRDSTLNEVIAEQAALHGGEFVLEAESSRINFSTYTVVPSAEEYSEMDAKRAREKEDLAVFEAYEARMGKTSRDEKVNSYVAGH